MPKVGVLEQGGVAGSWNTGMCVRVRDSFLPWRKEGRKHMKGST